MELWAAIAFAVSGLFIIYVLFGYPLLLTVMAQTRSRRVERGLQQRTVSVLLPVHNGERYLESKLRSILALDYPRDLVQILVVSDGSSDGTEQIAQSFAGHGVELISIAKGGKAVALNAALERARGEILFLTDVRQELERDSLALLVSCYADSSVGVASGELIIRKGGTTEEDNVGLYWKYEKWIRRRLSQIDSVLGATGAIYTMRRNLASPLPPGTLLDDVHLPLNAFFQGFRIIFVEEARAYDYPTALEAEFARKVRTLAGVYQVIGAFPALLGPKNRMWIHFVSHKLGRLLLPFALIALFVSSFGLSSPFASLALTGQIALYTLAFIDRWLPEEFPLKRLSSFARTFAVMMWAAFCAASILFRPSETFWKSPTAPAKP